MSDVCGRIYEKRVFTKGHQETEFENICIFNEMISVIYRFYQHL